MRYEVRIIRRYGWLLCAVGLLVGLTWNSVTSWLVAVSLFATSSGLRRTASALERAAARP